MPRFVSFARVGLVSALVALGVFAGLTASATLTSGDSPALQVQGDVNCDTRVDSTDVLGELDYVAQVTPAVQHEPCTDVGEAIPTVASPQVILFANVTISGNPVTIVDGNATKVASYGTGAYYLQFAQNIQHCAAVASAGSTAGGNYSTYAIATTHIDLPNATTNGLVGVQIVDPQGHPLDSDFHVIMVC